MFITDMYIQVYWQDDWLFMNEANYFPFDKYLLKKKSYYTKEYHDYSQVPIYYTNTPVVIDIFVASVFLHSKDIKAIYL